MIANCSHTPQAFSDMIESLVTNKTQIKSKIRELAKFKSESEKAPISPMYLNNETPIRDMEEKYSSFSMKDTLHSDRLEMEKKAEEQAKQQAELDRRRAEELKEIQRQPVGPKDKVPPKKEQELKKLTPLPSLSGSSQTSDAWAEARPETGRSKILEPIAAICGRR